LQKTTKREALLPQAIGGSVVREEATQFIPKDGRATWFQHDHGQAGIHIWFERSQDSLQIFFGRVEQSEIIERSAAAQMSLGLWNVNGKARAM
jgi:hypothetical protein